MADSEQLVDPELEGLLREFSTRPRSVFLRSSRKDAMRILRSSTNEPLSALAVPDALERELITVHRAELAEILKQACRNKLLKGERERLFVMRYRTANERVEPVPIQGLRDRFALADARNPGEPWAGATDAIERALFPQASAEPSVLELAALGERLVPGDSWRVMTAIDQLANGNVEAVRPLCSAVLDGCADVESSLRALETIAMSEAIKQSPSRALEAQSSACAIKGDYPLGHINLFLFAVDKRTALGAADRLEESIAPDHPLVLELSAASRRRWTGNCGAPRAAARVLANELKPAIGQVGGRLASAF
ncbi:MAG: hypothetical protein IPJ19_15605 [Planctomycetes bacterium]|nr:hypothetical protein [Planctomycetota bacterium]